MKKITLFLLLLIQGAWAQNFNCGTVPEIIEQAPFSRMASSADDVKRVYNIFFYVIKNTNGTMIVDQFGESEIMEALYFLNKNFNTFNIFFKYRGFEVINDDVLTNTYLMPPFHKPGCISVFFKNSLQGATGSAVQGNTKLQLTFDPLHRELTLCHEMGHCFNLLHTFNFTTPCEHVTRNPQDANYNADSAGDFVTDTPAVGAVAPSFQNCVYQFNPIYQDCEGTPYQDILPGNYLSSTLSNCGYHFTQGQILKMRAYVANPTLGWPSVVTSINSLYEPFEVTDVPGNVVVNISDNHDGTAEVCRNIWRRHRFQRSFDYVFEETFGTDPAGATTFDLPVVQENTLAFHVKINQVDPAVARTVDVICTKGVLCATEPFVGGRVISKEFLTSVNLTVKELTEIEAKDPELFDKLLEHYYHHITKYTASGAQMQTLIYKQ